MPVLQPLLEFSDLRASRENRVRVNSRVNKTPFLQKRLLFPAFLRQGRALARRIALSCFWSQAVMQTVLTI
jgi:hypothetical protein